MAAALPPLVRRRAGTDALVLAFHNVVPPGEPVAGDRSLHLPQGDFAARLDQLAATHDVVSLDEILRPPPDSAEDRPRAAITFDDGYRGALTAGVAELAARGMPATFFVVPGWIGTDGFWWDALAPNDGALPDAFRDEALARGRGEDAAVRDLARRRGMRAQPLPPHARPASLPEIVAAAGVAGMRIGAHTWSHPNLARLSPPELQRELEAPLEWMRAHVAAAAIPWLSYPYGSASPEVEHAAARAGYAGAVRVGGGWVRGGADPFAVPRVTRRVLVTDGGERAALAVVRSLAAAGHTVRVCSPAGRSLAGASRGCAGEDRVPDPLAAPDAYAAAVQALCAAHGTDALVPVGEASALALLPEDARPPGVVIPFPSLDVFRAACDKRRVLEAAAAAGIAVPLQRVVERPEERMRIAPGDVAFPAVLKPARSIVEAGGGRVKTGVVHAADWVRLQAALADLPRSAYPVLVQQRVRGPGTGIFLLVWDGGVRAVFAHRRLREKPPAGGVSVYRESVAPDPALVARAAALLRALGWRGVAMVELKTDEATGTPHLMEINGRFWGSLQLAIDAGVDFPALLLDAAFGAPAAPPPPWRPGVRSRWEWGDVDHLLLRLRRSRAALDLPPDTPGRLRALLDWAAVRRADRGEVFRWRDPAPAFRESLDWLARR